MNGAVFESPSEYRIFFQDSDGNVCYFVFAILIPNFKKGSTKLLEALWLLAPGDYGSNPSGGEKFSSFIFKSQSHDCNLLTFELIQNYAT